MNPRYLFGPVPRNIADAKLAGPRQAGQCLTFHPHPEQGDLLLRPTDTWEELLGRLPLGWKPDLLVLSLPYSSIPNCLWRAPIPRLALASDWNLLWHYFRRRLPTCDITVSDSMGAELLNRLGLRQVFQGNLCGCDRSFTDPEWQDTQRDIDILVVGNFNPAVQSERMRWLGRLARFGHHWRVVFRTGIFGPAYRHLLERSRIVFHASNRHKVGPRAFEAAATGALIFQERDNLELPNYFHDRKECVLYDDANVESLLEHYLKNEDERLALTKAARARVVDYRFEDFWEDILARIEPSVGTRSQSSSIDSDGVDIKDLLTRCWQALQSSQWEDIQLVADLEKALQADPTAAQLHNALGVLLSRQSQGRNSYKAAAMVAADCFRRALACQPEYLLAGMNLAEALAAAEQNLAAIEAARRTLESLQSVLHDSSHLVDGLIWGRSFDLLGVEWERAAWEHVGFPEEEVRAKNVLLRWRLQTLLAQWTGELTHAYEAAFLRPNLPASRAILGMSLLRANHPVEAVDHLRAAVVGNPLDRVAARACSQALSAVGDNEGLRRHIDDQHALWQACPSLVPAEPWYFPPRPSGKELASIIILCCNKLDYTRQCLESILRHTPQPHELVLVDNGSSDGTWGYLETIRQRRLPASTILIRNNSNCGYPAGCNQALEQAKGHYLVFLNNDTIVTAGWLENLIALSLHDWPRVGLVGPVSNGAMDAQHVHAGYAELDDLDKFATQRRQAFAGKMQEVDRLTGFCLLTRRGVLDRIGRLDERFGMGFFEDDDLCVRAREAGYRLLLAKDVYIHHFGNATFQELGIDVRERLLANFELFKAKWGPQYASGYHLPAPRPPANEDSATTDITPRAGVVPQSLAQTTGLLESDRLEGVSLCMIVRNEEQHLPGCLKSVGGLFQDIVIVDTGSSDGTRAIAESFGARVFDFPWQDSFGAARNESLRNARGKWVLWLDADDRLDEENRNRLAEVMASLGDELDAYSMKVRSVLNVERSAFRILDQVRLFRNLPSIRWDYRIHEQILPSVNNAGGVVRWAEVFIDHVGYVDPSARRRKLERNLRLLEMDYVDRPEDGFTLFNLGWTLMDLGRTADGLTYLQTGLEKTRPSSSTLRKLYHLLALANRHLGHKDEALEMCRQGLEKFPLDAELLCEEGLLLREKEDWIGAEKSWLSLLDAQRGQYFASEEVGLRGFRTRQLLAEIYRVQDRHLEAEVQFRAALAERSDFEPAWLGLAELLLRDGRWHELEYFLQDLEQSEVNPARIGWMRARGQVQRGDLAAARKTLIGVVSQDPKALGPRVLLSQVLLQEGRDWVAAEHALREVLEIDSNHAETRHNLQVLLRRLGRESTIVFGDEGNSAIITPKPIVTPNRNRPRGILMAPGG